MNSSQIGLHQAGRMCNMSAAARLEFIAEGLPEILESARSLLRASRELKAFPREAAILEGQAEEEAAKCLILVDVVRCPDKVIPSRIGDMAKRWFYSHLARLLYSEAQTWQPTSVKELQEYVDTERRSHYLEGAYGEYILPNSSIFTRETMLYVDVMVDENANPSWISPMQFASRFEDSHNYSEMLSLDPKAYSTAEALSVTGAFSLPGLKIMHEVWGAIDFLPDQPASIADRLCSEMLTRLHSGGLIPDTATEESFRTLMSHWQVPMYHLDFSPVEVSLDVLKQVREANFHAEFGGPG